MEQNTETTEKKSMSQISKKNSPSKYELQAHEPRYSLLYNQCSILRFATW